MIKCKYDRSGFFLALSSGIELDIGPFSVHKIGSAFLTVDHREDTPHFTVSNTFRKAKISSSIKFSNRSDPKRQLEASNQFYSLLWSKKASLQTVIDNLLTHGINNQNEDISSGMVLFQCKAIQS